MFFFQKKKFVLHTFLLNIVNNNLVIKTWSQKTESFLVVLPKQLKNNLIFLKTQSTMKFKQLTDVAGIDFPNNSLRFSICYILLSPNNSFNIYLTIKTNEIIPVPTITKIFHSADWSEREVWDLFGIYFIGHNNLERILTDYGFSSYPLRKTFPLTGFTELIYNPTNLNFNYLKFEKKKMKHNS